MVNTTTFKQVALSFPGSIEQPHFEKTSFRVNGKIFATLDLATELACVKLNETDQSVFCAIDNAVIYPVNNKLGQQGWTFINLNKVTKSILKDALSKSFLESTLKKKRSKTK